VRIVHVDSPVVCVSVGVVEEAVLQNKMDVYCELCVRTNCF
jgi:hypothetical protein